MKIAVLGSGTVGQVIASKLVQLGHQVKMGSRTATNEKAVRWAQEHGASAGTFSDAAASAELIFNCTAGISSLEALMLAGKENLKDKVLIDLSNPLDFSKGMPPTLSIVNDDSLGEAIQRAFPDTKVVKTLNTVNNQLMVNPSLVPGDHNIFVCGNDDKAKEKATEILQSFGWKKENILDLGDIKAARGVEQMLPIWVQLMGRFNSPMFNFHIVRPQSTVSS